MHVMVPVQPYMPVYTRPLIKPSLILGGIHPYDQNIFLVEIQIVGNIIGNTAIPAGIVAQVKAIDPYLAVPEDSVELNDKTLPRIGPRYTEMLAVPAYAVLRI